jgi:hypothetical protein
MNRSEQGEHGDALADVRVLCFVDEANVPAKGGTLVPGVLSLSEQERELERGHERMFPQGLPRPYGDVDAANDPFRTTGVRAGSARENDSQRLGAVF